METPATSRAPAATLPAASPRVFSRQVTGLVLWVGLLSLLGGFAILTVCLTLGSLTFADAWKSGIYKRSDRLRTVHAGNGFHWALVIVGAALIVAFVGNLILWM